MGLLFHVFDHFAPVLDRSIAERQNGVMIANAQGTVLAYALFNLQERGRLMVAHGDEVYEGQIVGIHSRDNDLVVNPLKAKKLTNIRAAGRDENIILSNPVRMTLEQAMEFIDDDELVEVTPESIRLRKRALKERAASFVAARGGLRNRLRRCGGSRPVRARSAFQRLDRLRRRDIVPLRILDADVGEPRQHLRGIDAFGDRADPHRLTDLRDGLDQSAIDPVVRHVVHELPVDLQEVDRQVLQEYEGREPAAEVVEREPAAALAQLADEVLCIGEAAHGGRLGHLEAQRAGLTSAAISASTKSRNCSSLSVVAETLIARMKGARPVSPRRCTCRVQACRTTQRSSAGMRLKRSAAG